MTLSDVAPITRQYHFQFFYSAPENVGHWEGGGEDGGEDGGINIEIAVVSIRAINLAEWLPIFFEIINIKVKIELSLASYFVVFLSTSKLTDTPEVSIEKSFS